ncbi:MAG: DUF3137 domain-containing protein [Chitinophagaceae bacterium]|nr:MAG: DUF3137 domain-containing protein [Chitinophagaceae bacterium]
MAANTHINIANLTLFDKDQAENGRIETNFERFYETNLQPYLLQIGLTARAYKNWKYFTIGAAILGVVFICLYQFLKIESAGLIALCLFIMAVTGVYYTTQKKEAFIDDFKEKIISRIIHHISAAAVYRPMQYLSKKEYKLSGLYRRRFSSYEGDDYWKARYLGLDFHCSELLVRYEDSTTATTLFKGLFIAAGISNYYSAGTYVWTKGEIQLPSSIADEAYRMYPLPNVQRYPAEDEQFNKSFSVYSSNFSEAGKILTPARQQKMLALKHKIGRDLVFSFVAGKCFVAIPMEDDLLEPTAERLQDKESYKKYFFTFLLVFNIVRELELNKLQ